MVQFNTRKRELIIKVVYYGPGLSGKTTNLKHIHRATDPGSSTQLISLNTEKDRTLFFDLLPYDIGVLSGMKIKLQLYTVPGQSKYRSTRKAVLKGADGIVFVADSQRYMMASNIDNFKDMIANLSENKVDYNKIPVVMQYNKRDLYKTCTVNELNNVLNKKNYPSFEAIAVSGDGVFETLIQILFLTVDYIVKEYDISAIANDIASIKTLIKKNLGKFCRDQDTQDEMTASQELFAIPVDGDTVKQEMASPPSEPSFTFDLLDPIQELDNLQKEFSQDSMTSRNDSSKTADIGIEESEDEDISDEYLVEAEEIEAAEGIDDKTLIEKAVDSNMKISQLYIQVEDITKKLNEKLRELSVLNQVSNLMASEENVTEVLKRIFQLTMDTKDIKHGALLVPQKNGFKQLICIGFNEDPLNNLMLEDGQPALCIIASRKSVIAANMLNGSSMQGIGIKDNKCLKEFENRSIDSFVVAPLISKGIIHGVFNFYRVNSTFEFNKEDVEFINSLATQAALVIENTKLKHRSESSNKTDEAKIVQNLKRLLLVVQKRLNANLNALNSLNEFVVASSQNHLEVIIENEKEMNNRILKTLKEIIKEN